MKLLLPVDSGGLQKKKYIKQQSDFAILPWIYSMILRLRTLFKQINYITSSHETINAMVDQECN